MDEERGGRRRRLCPPPETRFREEACCPLMARLLASACGAVCRAWWGMEELVGFDALADLVLIECDAKIEWEMFSELCHRLEEEPTPARKSKMIRVMSLLLHQGDRELIARVRRDHPTRFARHLAFFSYPCVIC